MSHPSICIVITWFGRWPFWIDFFLESCRWNPSVNWLIYTDCKQPERLPDNVKLVELSFTDYKKQVSERLGISFNPSSAYKLCDLKPVLGYLHEDELSGYDFWAFGDLDLVYGDLRSYFIPELLNRYHCISTLDRRLSGHLCLFRNNRELREAFKRCDGWQKVLAADEHVAFDEKQFSELFMRHKNFPAWLRKLVLSFDPLARNAFFKEAYTTPNLGIPWVDGSRNFPTEWYWQEGKISHNGAQGQGLNIPYFHMMYLKGDVWPGVQDQCSLINVEMDQISRGWKVSAGGFSPLSGV